MNEAKKFFLPSWAINPETGRIYDEIAAWFSAYTVAAQGDLVILTGYTKSDFSGFLASHFSVLEYSILCGGIHALCGKIYTNDDHFICFAKDKYCSAKLREISKSMRDTLSKMKAAISWVERKKEQELATSWGDNEQWICNGNVGYRDYASHQMGGG